MSISDTTGEMYYSGTWKDVKSILSVLGVDEGKMAQVVQPMVEVYQEMVDRYIDDILSEVYHVPLIAMNRVQPDGKTKRVFPGALVRAARYWTGALLLQNEFQQLSQNVTEQATTYLNDAQRQIYGLRRPQARLLGQTRKSNVSRTLPPNMQPTAWPELEM